MQTHILPTNMHCGACVAKLAKVLDGRPGIHQWSADVSNPEKRVTVQGSISRNELVGLIEQAGFKTAAGPAAACSVAAQQVPKKAAGFWSDKKIWRRSAFNTFNCLVGCSIGDFGMIIYLQVYHPGTPMWLQMTLAVMAGLLTSIALETSILHIREKLVWKAALKMALSMSLISMVGMELAMNVTDFMITGGKAQLTSAGYWLAFIPAAVAGFLAPLPYNYFQLKKHNRACH